MVGKRIVVDERMQSRMARGMDIAGRRLADIRVGDELPPLSRTVTRVTIFMFGVAYWSTHRLHYDVEYARAAGFSDVLVTANLLSAYNAELVTRWTAPAATLRSLEERNVASAVAGDTVVARGRVSALEPGAGGGLVWCDLEMSTQSGIRVTQGRASVFVPDGMP